jgi:hypothetical protein
MGYGVVDANLTPAVLLAPFASLEGRLCGAFF